ncbi:MAG TPA: cytochrome c [Alphaproteobacteria bacterium]
MRPQRFWWTFAAASVLAFAACTLPAAAQSPDHEAVRRGEYLFNAGGCFGCHTDVKGGGPPLAGGRPLHTPFGTFYGPNITPDPDHGIGRWTEADFIRAMRQGIRPDGAHYYPVFPYTSFTGMTDGDLRDLWAYLRSVPPVARPNRAHEVRFPFSLRPLLTVWKWLNFTPGPFSLDDTQPPDVNRGAYLVRAVAHCGECHTPRDALGGPDSSRLLAGTSDGPDGERVPNITPHPETGIGAWSTADLLDVLKLGMTPDGDFVGGSMGEVVRNTTSKLSDDDLRAVVAYLKSLPPVENRVARRQRTQE